MCRGKRVRLVDHVTDKDGAWEAEEYVCSDCGCQWDWLFTRPFFRFNVKLRSPKWVRIE